MVFDNLKPHKNTLAKPYIEVFGRNNITRWTEGCERIIQLDSGLLKRIEERARLLRDLKLSSIWHEQDYRSAATGEIMFETRWADAKRSQGKPDVYNFDYMLYGKKFEVKTRTFINANRVRSHYEGAVPTYTEHGTQTDYLVFYGTNLSRGLGYEIAYCLASEFFPKAPEHPDRIGIAKFFSKGTQIPGMPEPLRCDQYRMEYKDMYPISELSKLIEGWQKTVYIQV